MIPNKTARNERRKITATYLNTLASAIVVVGGLAPIASLAYGTLSGVIGLDIVALGSAVCIMASLSLHWLARYLLKGIEE